MYLLDDKYEKYKKQHTPVFQECLDLIKEDYEMAKTRLDCMEYLKRDNLSCSIDFQKEHLEKKVAAYESLFPFFCS